MRSSSKIQQCAIYEEGYDVKEYLKALNPKQARLKYRERYFMLKGVKLNFPSDRAFIRDGFKCDYCPLISSQNHLINYCPEFECYRLGRNLNDDSDLCDYLADVMKFRLGLNEEDA